MAKQEQAGAYDFAMFEPKPSAAPQEEPERKAKILEMPKDRFAQETKRRRGKKTSGARRTVVFLGILALACVLMIISQVRLAELTSQIETTTEALTEAESLYTQYQMRSDSQLSLTSVEEYAEKNLGMAKADQTQMEYIELSADDKAEVMQPEDENWFVSAWRFVVNLLS
jgi:uncharacterized protein HemX